MTMVLFRGLGSLVLAAAGLVEVAVTASSLSTRQDSSKTVLRTRVLTGDFSKDGLYIQAYHTGAGLNDATLTSNISEASPVYLNESYLLFDLDSDFPWGMKLAYNQYYTEWLDVEINAGYGDGGFFISSSGLVSNNTEWRGWLVCDWYHLTPQLFWRYYFTDFALPCNCASVELCLETA